MSSPEHWTPERPVGHAGRDRCHTDHGTGDRRFARDERGRRRTGAAAHPRRGTGNAPGLRTSRSARKSFAVPVPGHGPGPPGGPRGQRVAAPGPAGYLGAAAWPGGRAGRLGTRAEATGHGVPQLPRARHRLVPGHAAGAERHGHLPMHGPRQLGSDREPVQPVHHRHRQPGHQCGRLRDGTKFDGKVGDDDGEATVCFFGDGATSQGDVHEGFVWASA